MHLKLLEVLACPKCLCELACEPFESEACGDIIKGSLQCVKCSKIYTIERGIPRFVDQGNYAASFGYQWNQFRLEQLDFFNGTRLSEKRFYTETGWSREWIKGKWILDAGCGAGRFLDVVSKADGEIVGIDISNAVDAAMTNLADRKNVHLIQASIYELPFRPAAFDGCYSIGVIQHTPNPTESLQSLPRILKNGGQVAVTIYERKTWTLLHAKYLIRPLTKKLNKRILLHIIKAAMPILFPVTDFLFRIPYIGPVFNFVIPVANYVHGVELSRRQRYDWAILDTFDMLAPQYDQPQTQKEVEQALFAKGIEDLTRLTNIGLNLVGRKGASIFPSGPFEK